MENTIENKAKFLALYLGCEVEYPSDEKTQKSRLTSVGFEEIETTFKRKKKGHHGDILSFKSNGYHDNDALHAKLLLKPISAITDEDLKACNFRFSEGVRIEFEGTYWTAFGKQGFMLGEGYLTPQNIDYLRSKSYILPWMGLSIEKMAEYGWVKFIH